MKYSTIAEFTNVFKDEQTCIDYLTQMRWNGNIACPHCENKEYYKFKDNKTYKCKSCKLKFNVKTKSIFENSNAPLSKWLMAIYLCSSLKSGINSVNLAKAIGVTQSTSWFMLHRLRLVFENQQVKMFSGGIIEMDETYVGGQVKNKHTKERKAIFEKFGTGSFGQIPVFGMLQRGGNVLSIAFKDLDKVDGTNLKPVIRDKISKDTILVTDGFGGYYGLNKEFKQHEIVYHSRKQFTKGNYSTNTLEGYWSILKRTLRGTYITVSRKHINKYCKEIDFRYNTRKECIQDKIELILQNCNGRLKYKNLIK